MNKGGFLIYKCRRCGKLNKNIHVPDGLIAISHLLVNGNLHGLWGGAIASLKDICSCNDGNIGVTDLIGCEFDK